MLDDAAIHVDDVERAVGRVREDRPAGTARRSTRGTRRARYALRAAHRRAVVVEDEAADEVGGRLGDEHVAVELGRQPIAAIDHRRADGRELRQRAVRAIDAGLIGAVGARIRPHRPDDVQVRRCRWRAVRSCRACAAGSGLRAK